MKLVSIFAYPFPDVAALMDFLYISRSSAVRPTLQTLALIQSSTSFSHDLIGLPLFLWPVTFPSSIISPVLGVFLCVQITSFLLLNKVNECSRCDSKFISYGLVCSVFNP